MFNRKSRTLAFAMSLALVFGLCPTVALAEGEGDPGEGEPVLVAQDDGKIDLADVYDNTGLQAYDDGNPITAKLQLVYYGDGSGKALVVGEDYNITKYYSVANGGREEVAAPQAEGEYVALVEGIGDYTGQKEVSFTVSSCKDFRLVSVGEIQPLVYNGTVQYPAFSVMYEHESLALGTHYTLGETMKLTTGTADDPGSAADPIEVGSYRVKLVGKQDGGYIGERWAYFSIVAGDDFSKSAVSGIERLYPYTGQEVAPTFSVALPNGTALTAGVDYDYYYTTSVDTNTRIVPKDLGSYALHLVGKGSYAGVEKKFAASFEVADMSRQLSQATLSGFAIRYPYTGRPITVDPRVSIGSTVLSVGLTDSSSGVTKPDCTVMVMRFVGAQTPFYLSQIVAPGHYLVIVNNGANGYSGSLPYATEFYIYDPNTTVEGELTTEVDSKTGVAVAGTLFDEMNVDGNEVRVNVEDVASSNPTRSADLERQYKDADAEFFKVIDVNLDLLNSEGDVIAPLTEQLNKLNLTFPVDEALNGRTATIVQLHKNAATGATEEIRMTAPVVDGGVTVTVDQLSEFVVSVEPENEGGNSSGNGETITRPASALPNTGDDLPLPGMLFVAALAAGASIAALRREASR